MHYEGTIIRPPSEADSLIVQFSVGCSHNRCTFCPTYKGERFRLKDPEIVLADIREAARFQDRFSRVFVADGDALIAPFPRLQQLMLAIRQHLPRVTRVGMYANAKAVMKRPPEELAWLREHGLGIVYLGIESGDDRVLQAVRKGSNAARLETACHRVREAGIDLSVTVLLGLAGREGGTDHARATGELLSRISPDYIGVLSLMVVPGTELFDAWQSGGFCEPSPRELLAELGLLLRATDVSRPCLFTSNHASNHLPLRLRLPGDRQAGLALIDRALKDGGSELLRPEWMRAL